MNDFQRKVLTAAKRLNLPAVIDNSDENLAALVGIAVNNLQCKCSKPFVEIVAAELLGILECIETGDAI